MASQIHPAKTKSVKEAAAYVGLSTYLLKKHCDAGRIASVFDGPRRLVFVDSLDAWLDSLPTERPDGAA